MEMDKLIAEFPNNIADAVKIATNASFKNLNKTFSSVIICGMGGSGIGGKLVGSLVADECTLPISYCSDYNLPKFVSKNTLVIGSSCSGNTEETLTAIDFAIEAGATIVCVTSGGKMLELCKKNGFDHVVIPGGNPPRTGLAFSFVQIVNILSKAAVISDTKFKHIAACKAHLDNNIDAIKTEAKNIVNTIHNKEVAIYSTAIYEPLAVRARQQFNENAKILCWHHVIPEMNHNELVGWGGGTEDYSVLFIDTQFMLDRNRKRFELSQEIIQGKTKSYYTLKPKGANVMEEVFYIIHVVDWASLYLCEMRNEDPIEIRVIDYLKGELAKF